jgi:hypothetical protein
MPNLKKTIQFNPLEAPSSISKTAKAPKLIDKKNQAPKRKSTPKVKLEEASVTPDQTLETTEFVIQATAEHGTAPLLSKGSDFGFEVPGLGFISLKSAEMLSQLKEHFLLPRVIGGFVLGGSLGYAVSFILGKPKNKLYFFLLKSSHGNVVFSCMDSQTLAYVIKKIYT